jgi:replication initiation protein RepC
MVETDPKEPENRPHQYKYNPTLNPEQDTVIAANEPTHEAGMGGPLPAELMKSLRVGAVQDILRSQHG